MLTCYVLIRSRRTVGPGLPRVSASFWLPCLRLLVFLSRRRLRARAQVLVQVRARVLVRVLVLFELLHQVFDGEGRLVDDGAEDAAADGCQQSPAGEKKVSRGQQRSAEVSTGATS